MLFFELLVWPHEVESSVHSWYRGRVETLDAKYNLIFWVTLFELLVWPHRVELMHLPRMRNRGSTSCGHTNQCREILRGGNHIILGGCVS